MSDVLAVHVNRERPQAIEVETGSFEASGSFVVAIHNHGRPVHVHVHLDDALSTVARLEAANHYVEGDSVAEVPVSVEGPQRPVSGKLKIVTGYGAQTEYVDVELIDAEEAEEHVRVDETLSKPQRVEEPEPLVDTSIARNGPIAALGGFALLLAVAVASMTGGAVLLGVLAVLAGVAVAGYFLIAR